MIQLRRKLSYVAIVSALVALSGCTTMSAMNRKSLDDYRQADAQTKSRLIDFQSKNGTGQAQSVMSDMPYVNVHTVSHKGAYPASFYEAASLSVPSVRIWELMQSLQAKTHLTVNADDDLMNGASTPGLPPAPTGALDATLTPPGGGGGGVTGHAGAASRLSVGPISYQGTEKGLLDTIASNMDATWSYDEHTRTIHFFRYETKSFHIETVPGDALSDSSIESGTGSAVQGGQGQSLSIASSKTNAEFKGSLSVWSSVLKNVTPMLSAGGSLNISEPTATITVRDRWDRLDAVATYIDSINKSLGTQVEVNVTVYRIHAADSDNRGINYSVLYNGLGQAASSIGGSISTARPTATGLSSLIIDTPTKRADGSTPPFAGSQFFLDALSTLGKTSVVTNTSVDTVNNMPAPVKVIQTTAYVAQTTSLLTTGTGSSSGGSVVGAGATLTPGQVETGFNMLVLPSVQEDGHRLLLQVMLSISTLDSLPTFSSGGETIQLPQVSAREFMQRVWMKSGEALVLAGFQNTEADNTTQSPLSQSLWMVGGNRTVANTRDALVIVITPIATAPQTTL
jgi:type IVB pilus formation R64 PilN family outer membrane protein